MRILCVGDLHVGKLDTIMGEELALHRQVGSLTKQIDWATSKGIRHGVVCGDVFDDPHPTKTHMIAVMEALASSKMEWVVYRGNHDVEDAKNDSLELLSRLPKVGALRNVRFVSRPETFKWHDVRLSVIPWAARYSRSDFDASADVVFFHDNLVGAKRDNGRVIEPGQGLSRSAFRDAPIAVSGHLHTPQRVGSIHFCGTAAQMSFGERANKRLLILEKARSGLNPRSVQWDPVWKLENVLYDPDNPPACNASGTLYKLDVSRGSPGPSWMSDHPQVVRMSGSSNKDKQRVAKEIAHVTNGNPDVGDDDLLHNWLKAHSSLNEDDIRRAIKIDERLGS